MPLKRSIVPCVPMLYACKACCALIVWVGDTYVTSDKLNQASCLTSVSVAVESAI